MSGACNLDEVILLCSVLQHQITPVCKISVDELFAHLSRKSISFVIPDRGKVTLSHFKWQTTIHNSRILHRRSIFHITIIHPFHIVHEFGHAGYCLIAYITIVCNVYFHFRPYLSRFSSNDDYTVRGACTINGCGGGVFQYIYFFYIRRVQEIDIITYHSIYYE